MRGCVVTVQIDVPAIMQEPTTVAAMRLAVREGCDMRNSQRQRDEWNRVQFRHLFDYIYPENSRDIH
jgi:hypothetical protein